MTLMVGQSRKLIANAMAHLTVKYEFLKGPPLWTPEQALKTWTSRGGIAAEFHKQMQLVDSSYVVPKKPDEVSNLKDPADKDKSANSDRKQKQKQSELLVPPENKGPLLPLESINLGQLKPSAD